MQTGELVSNSLPSLTVGSRGVGGIIKRYDEDFVVEEIPLYPACGEGTHIYFTIEKRGLPTLAALDQIARALGVRTRDIGYAGLKDAHGVTRQRLSIEHIDPERVRSLTFRKITVIDVTRHTNKLKLGHLAGNRFVIKVRETIEDPLPRARDILDVLIRRGVPNYFGPQRFGTRGDNAGIGLAVLRDEYDKAFSLMLGRPLPQDRPDVRRARELFEGGDLLDAADAWPKGAFSQQARLCRALGRADGDARKAWRAVDHSLRKLYVSAVQSELFNRVVALRIEGIDKLLTGDLAYKHRNGACFRVEDAAAEQSRCDAQEISPTGPLFGRRMTEPTGEPARIEQEVLTQSGLDRTELRARDGTRLDGARRPLRVPLADAEAGTGSDDHGPFLELRFTLTPGAYATNVTREVCKSGYGAELSTGTSTRATGR